MINLHGIFTKNYHLESTKVPEGNLTFEYEDCTYSSTIHEFKTVTELINATTINLKSLIDKGYEIYAKPFYSYMYDKDLLEVYNVSNDILQHIHAHHCFFKSYVQANQRTDNQTYMINGIKHNIVDSILLLNDVNNIRG